MKFNREHFSNGLLGGAVGMFGLLLLISCAEKTIEVFKTSARLDVCKEASEQGVRDKLKTCEWKPL